MISSTRWSEQNPLIRRVQRHASMTTLFRAAPQTGTANVARLQPALHLGKVQLSAITDGDINSLNDGVNLNDTVNDRAMSTEQNQTFRTAGSPEIERTEKLDNPGIQLSIPKGAEANKPPTSRVPAAQSTLQPLTSSASVSPSLPLGAESAVFAGTESVARKEQSNVLAAARVSVPGAVIPSSRQQVQAKVQKAVPLTLQRSPAEAPLQATVSAPASSQPMVVVSGQENNNPVAKPPLPATAQPVSGLSAYSEPVISATQPQAVVQTQITQTSTPPTQSADGIDDRTWSTLQSGIQRLRAQKNLEDENRAIATSSRSVASVAMHQNEPTATASSPQAGRLASNALQLMPEFERPIIEGNLEDSEYKDVESTETAQPAESTATESQPLSLQTVWRVNRIEPSSSKADTGQSAVQQTPQEYQEPPHIGEPVRRKLEEKETAKPTEAKIDVIAPRRQRPVMPASPGGLVQSSSAQSLSVLQRALAATQTEQTVDTGETKSGPKDNSDAASIMVETDIGSLPSDLWHLIGEQPPITEPQSAMADVALPKAVQRVQQSGSEQDQVNDNKFIDVALPLAPANNPDSRTSEQGHAIQGQEIVQTASLGETQVQPSMVTQDSPAPVEKPSNELSVSKQTPGLENRVAITKPIPASIQQSEAISVQRNAESLDLAVGLPVENQHISTQVPATSSETSEQGTKHVEIQRAQLSASQTVTHPSERPLVQAGENKIANIVEIDQKSLFANNADSNADKPVAEIAKTSFVQHDPLIASHALTVQDAPLAVQESKLQRIEESDAVKQDSVSLGAIAEGATSANLASDDLPAVMPPSRLNMQPASPKGKRKDGASFNSQSTLQDRAAIQRRTGEIVPSSQLAPAYQAAPVPETVGRTAKVSSATNLQRKPLITLQRETDEHVEPLPSQPSQTSAPTTQLGAMESKASQTKTKPINTDTLAEQVYKEIRRKLVVERERLR